MRNKKVITEPTELNRIILKQEKLISKLRLDNFELEQYKTKYKTRTIELVRILMTTRKEKEKLFIQEQLIINQENLISSYKNSQEYKDFSKRRVKEITNETIRTK